MAAIVLVGLTLTASGPRDIASEAGLVEEAKVDVLRIDRDTSTVTVVAARQSKTAGAQMRCCLLAGDADLIVTASAGRYSHGDIWDRL
jgi:hypothetical protein